MINKNGIFEINTNSKNLLVRNFTDWTFASGSTINGNTVTLTGASPSITSTTFSVLPKDIIYFTFTLALPTPSTKTSGGGIYIGTKYGQTVYSHSFNLTTKKWVQATSTTTNPYVISSYNLSTPITLCCYILGSEVNLSEVPVGLTTSTSYAPRAIQLTTDTTTNIRSGYNSGNSTMEITFINPQIYKCNLQEDNTFTTVELSKDWLHTNNFYEY